MNTKSIRKGIDDLLPILRKVVDPSLSEIAVAPLTGDASNRSYFRITYSKPAPGSVIVMTLNEPDQKIVSEEISDVSHTFTELPYLNILRHLEKAGLGVPKLLYDGEKEGFLLLEDLGNDLLATLVEHGSDDVKRLLYRKAIDALILMQVKGSKNGHTCYAFRQAYTHDLFLWEFHHFIEYHFDTKGLKIHAMDRKILDTHFRDISRKLSSEPRVFTHRDYHSWNIIVKKDEIKILDFQDALMGPRQYDLVSLLLDRSTPDLLGETLINEMIAYYCHAAGIEPEKFQDIFDLAGVQRSLKAAGRFDYIAQVKKNSSYLRYVPGTLKRVAAILSRHRDRDELLDVLARYIPEMR